ncbi:MAG TPA: histidine triad nucleotide-binding protein [Clostridiales bacterium]|nr:histidine triad nucleotide-binding protein [Clostridiales bacterium]
MEDCIFCKIIRKEIPSSIVYEDDSVIAFKDINPVAPVHILMVPKTHLTSVKEINNENGSILVSIHLAANEIAKKMGIYENGYRLINNCGVNAGQTVPHLHYHLIGGVNLGPKIV